ncbi:ZIP family metal transporter [Cyclobacteriaceae bacterium]|jgi:zinc transporter ZupT|nr:ZIP family metal transporter [Cyclobacteriaceae bacterium]|tara:strand:- start:512 stop:1225 length:714 start_codon:yes stop_codon:yes gene_type:complete
MSITLMLLIIGTFIGGLATIPLEYKPRNIFLPLIFGGSYLFSITIIHVFPELFAMSSNPTKIGLFILLGFFFQQFLEYFTSGVEHGHFHEHKSTKSKYYVLIALVVHSLMEGALLTHDSPLHEQNNSYTLLFGIILHKAPAAFALMAVFRGKSKFSKQQWMVLIIFSLASPIGAMANNYLTFSQEQLSILFAFVSGAFLHISTTIFVESSPGHRFRFNKIAISILAALLAIFTELYI